LPSTATAGERERGSLEPLLTVPVRREYLIFGKILATCAYMTLSLTLTVAAFAIMLRFTGLERFGMSVNFGPLVGLAVILFCLPLVPLGAALMTIVAASTRSYRRGADLPGSGVAGADAAAGVCRRDGPASDARAHGRSLPQPALPHHQCAAR